MSSTTAPGNLNAFDATCVVGRHRTLRPGGLHTAEDLLTEMDHFGIAEALVLDSLSREVHPEPGNRRVLEVAASSPRLHPAWALLPHGPSDEQPEPSALVDLLRRHRVGAVHLFPAEYQFPLDDWCVDPFLEPLAEVRVPVFINYNEGMLQHSWDHTDWPAVVALCRRHPQLPVIVSEFRIRRSQRTIYRALDACPNLRIDLAPYWLHHGVEFIAERWGADRLVFGSLWPLMGQGNALTMLTCSDVSDAVKRRVAGNNLRELVNWHGGYEAPAWEPSAPEDEFVAFGRTGERPRDMVFFDCHGHLGGRLSHYHLPDCDHDGIVREMDRLGVRKVLGFGFSGILGDETLGNDDTAEAVCRHPDHFVGLTMLNPHRGEEEMRRELERGAGMGLRGVKLIPHYQGYPENGSAIEVACRWAHERREFILNHWWDAAQLREMLEKYPDACYIQGHARTDLADLMVEYNNLFVCSVVLLEPRSCEEVVSAIGADRLLFGSDLQDLPIAWNLGPILFARISPDDKRKILGENLRRLLERYSLGG